MFEKKDVIHYIYWEMSLSHTRAYIVRILTIQLHRMVITLNQIATVEHGRQMFIMELLVVLGLTKILQLWVLESKIKIESVMENLTTIGYLEK